MRIIAAIVICCSVALAYDVSTECKTAIDSMDEVARNTASDAAVMILWRFRQIGAELTQLAKVLKKDSLLKAVVEEEEKLQFSATTISLLSALNSFQTVNVGNDPSKPMAQRRFKQLYEISVNIGKLTAEFFGCITRINERQESKDSLLILEMDILNSYTEQLYLIIQFAMEEFYSRSLYYGQHSTEWFVKLNSILDGTLFEILEKSSYGKSIKPLIETSKDVLTTMKSVFDLASERKANNQREIDDTLFLQNVVIRMNSVFGFKKAHKAISSIKSALENAEKPGITALALPENSSVNYTCNKLNGQLQQLADLIIDIEVESESDNDHRDFLERFFGTTFPLGVYGFMLEMELFKITESLPKEDATPHETEKGPDFNIRHDYQTTMRYIDEDIFLKYHLVVPLIRRIWQDFAKALQVILTNKERKIGNKVKALLTAIMQKLRFSNITSFLKNIPSQISENRPFAIESVIVNNFEIKAKKLVDMFREANDADVVGFKKGIIDSQAAVVYSSIQLVLYRFNAYFAADKINQLDATANVIDGLPVLLNDLSDSSFKKSIKRLVKRFKPVTSTLHFLINLHAAHSAKPEENPDKLAFLHSIIDQLDDVYDLAFISEALLYAVEALKQLENDVTLGESEPDLNDTCDALQRHSSHLKHIRDFVENTLATVPQKDVGNLLPTISEQTFWALLADSSILKKQITEMVKGLPTPQENTDLHKLYLSIREKFEPEEVKEREVGEEEKQQGDAEIKVEEQKENIGQNLYQTGDKRDSIEDWLELVRVEKKQRRN